MKYLVYIILCVISLNSFTQEKNDYILKDSTELKVLSKNITPNGWIYFKDQLDIKPHELFIKHKKAFGLFENDTMVIYKILEDTLNQTHYRFKQYYKGIKIEHSEYILHSKGDKIYLGHGKIINNINIDIEHKISEDEAFNIAIKTVNADLYAWENEEWEKSVKVDMKDTNATWKPKAELVITRNFKIKTKEDYRLSYKFGIRTLIPDDDIFIHIDAKSGDVLNLFSSRTNASGSVSTVYNGDRPLIIYYRGWPDFDFVLRDKTRSSEIITKNQEYFVYYGNCYAYPFWSLDDIDDNDKHWSLGEDYNAGTSHWAVQNAYKFYEDKFGRTYGMSEDPDFQIRVLNNNNSLLSHSYPNGTSYDYIYVGKGYGSDATRYCGSLDGVGHEFTHGVSTHSCGLAGLYIYNFLSGAIFESFSDIFGECIEYYILGSTDWVAGGNFNTKVRRSFVNPSAYNKHTITKVYDGCYVIDCNYQYLQPYPWDYQYYNWRYDTNDISAHINCMVMNKWFYLLANGGSRHGITVNGIGIEKAMRVAYWTMVGYAGINSTFPTIRDASIESARYLYGPVSCEAKATQNAWAAVLNGTANNNPCYPRPEVYISGPYYLECYDAGTWEADASGGTGTYSYKWYYQYPGWSGWVLAGTSNPLVFTPDYSYNELYLKVKVTSGTQQEYSEIFETWLNCWGLKSTQEEKSAEIYEDSTLIIYPNPSNGIIFIKVLGDKYTEAQLLDITGRFIKGFNIYNNDFYLDITDQERGVYLLKLVSQDYIKILRIIKN